MNLFHNALKISEQNALKNHIASELNNIGLVYYSQGEYVQCLGYYNQSINILRETGDSMKIAQSLMNTGIVYQKQGIYDKATTLLLEAAKYFEKSNRFPQLSSCYNTIANTQSDLGYYSESLKYHFKALEIRRKYGDSTVVASSLNNIGITYKKLDSLNLAMDYFNQSLAIKNGLSNKTLISSTLTNIGVKNRIFDSEKTRAISELRIKFETEKNEAEIKTLNEIRESQARQIQIKTRMQHALLFGLTMFLILTLVIFSAYQQKRKSNTQIRTLMQERQHRAKNNLQIITELLGLQSAYLEHEQAKGAIKSGENRMHAVSLIDKMLYQNQDDTRIDMYEYTQKLVSNLAFLFNHQNRNAKTEVDADHFLLDASKATPLGLILNELVTNSFKYAFNECLSPELKIELRQNKEKQIMLIFSDNGPGLNKNIDLGKLNSLGLKLIHSLSRQLKGTLSIENRNGFYCRLIFKA